MAITSFSPDERIEVYFTVARKKMLKKCNFTRGRKITFKNTVVAYMLNRI